MSPPWILRRLANVSPFFNSLSNRLRITTEFQSWSVTYDYTLSYQKSSQYLKWKWNKVVTTKYLAKFQSSRAITRPNIIGPEWNVNLICNSSLSTHTPKIKSISPSIAKKVVTTKYLAIFQSPRSITQPNIIGPERNVILTCNVSLYTNIPNIKSISQSIAKKSGDNCFISEWRTWVTLYVPAT